MVKVSFFLLLFTLLQPGRAEYRAYRLQVNLDDKPVREVISTLDHVQYPEYYPLGAGETVHYIESWMCWGRTEAFEPACENPASDQRPATKP